MTTTPTEYRAKAAAALKQAGEAKTDAERQRLKRAHGVYLKLSTHEAEAAERAAMGPTPRIHPLKQPVAGPRSTGWKIT